MLIVCPIIQVTENTNRTHRKTSASAHFLWNFQQEDTKSLLHRSDLGSKSALRREISQCPQNSHRTPRTSPRVTVGYLLTRLSSKTPVCPGQGVCCSPPVQTTVHQKFQVFWPPDQDRQGNRQRRNLTSKRGL